MYKRNKRAERQREKQISKEKTMAQFSLIRYLHFVAVSLNKSKPWPVKKKNMF